MTHINLNDMTHVEQRKRDMLEQARRQHILHEAAAHPVPLADRLRSLVADVLVKPGRQIEADARQMGSSISAVPGMKDSA